MELSFQPGNVHSHEKKNTVCGLGIKIRIKNIGLINTAIYHLPINGTMQSSINGLFLD